MKKVIGAVVMLVTLAIAGAAFSFTPQATNYWRGQQDGEWTYAVVGGAATVKAGQWVGIAFQDTQGFDTGAVVATIATEGSNRIVGVAEEGGTGGQLIRVRTNGYTVAYIMGSDSSVAGGLSQGDLLSQGSVAGAAGSAAFQSGAPVTIAQFATHKPVGVLLETVAVTDTGLYNTYDVYVMCR